jgi:hypothetical protein
MNKSLKFRLKEKETIFFLIFIAGSSPALPKKYGIPDSGANE